MPTTKGEEMKQKRPPTLKAFLESWANNGDTGVHVAPSDRPSLKACWTVTITHPVHADYTYQGLYTRYVERVGWHVFGSEFDPRTGVVMFIVGPSQSRYPKE
jgi:hypothetical protein